MRANKQILETETPIRKAQSFLSSEPTFSHFSCGETEKLRGFDLLLFLNSNNPL